MSVFRKYDSKTNSWEPVASADATTVFSGNPILTDGETQSVEDILIKDRNDIEKLKKNVSWLALHGGGGGGGWGGGSGDSKATVQILSPMDNTTPVTSIIWKDSIQEIRVKVVSSYSGEYKLTVRMNGKVVYELSSVKRNTVVPIPASYLNVGSLGGTIEVIAIDDADMEYSATCKLTIASVDLQKPTTVTLTQNQLLNSNPKLILTYRTSIPGNYRMYYSNTMITYDPTVGWKDAAGALDNGKDRSQYIDMLNVGTTVSNLSVGLTDVGNGTSIIVPDAAPGVYARYFVMVSASDPTICSNVQSAQINVTITNGLLVSPQFGVDENEPYMISLDGVLDVRFITYSNLTSTYSYSIYNDFSSEPLVTATNAIYGNIISERISMQSAFGDKGEGLYTLTIKANGLGASAEAKVYLNVIKATTELATAYMQDLRNYTVFDYTFWDNMQNAGELNTFTNPNFYFASTGTHGQLNQTLSIYNKGADSMPTQVYYKMRHTCCGKIGSNGYTWFPQNSQDISSIIPGQDYQFTISLSYAIGAETNDNATVFNLGNYKPKSLNGDGTGYGILVTAHGVYIHIEDGAMECDLSDNDFTQLDIIFKRLSGAMEGYYRLMVYQNGVLLKATNIQFNSSGGTVNYTLSSFNTATIACRSLKSETNYYSTTDSINMDLYSVRMFTRPLNEGQIVCNYINNYANYKRKTDDSTLDAELINRLLTNNSIKSDSNVSTIEQADGSVIYDTSTISSLFDVSGNDTTDGGYNWGVTSVGDDVILGNNLANLPIPIITINVNQWTYSMFTSTSSKLPEATGCKFTYRDGATIVDNCLVTVVPQGTTSLTYDIKNVDVTFENAFFSPKASWFPEQTFTLKADIVDSGHMNNATIGAFVNSCLNETNLLNKDAFPVAAKIQEYRKSSGGSMPDSMTLKACIEGFPVLLIMNFLSDSGDARDPRVMGIYSFNLGRKSYINQGFEVLKCLRDVNGSIIGPDDAKFPSLYGEPQANDKDSTYEAYCFEGSRSFSNSVSEVNINDNTAVYDYAAVYTGNPNADGGWIWLPKVSNTGGYVTYLEQNILDKNNVPVAWNENNVKKYAINPDGYFWSDDDTYASSLIWNPIYTGTNSTQAWSSFKTLNNCIATKLQYNKGLFIDKTGRTGTCVRAYETTLPRYAVTSGEGENFTTAKVPGKEFNITRPQSPEPLEISVKNSAFYYVVCMLFGLVDSFGKNLQLKNWSIGNSQPHWSPTFYDMDTALGIDNTGKQTVKSTVFDESIINTPDSKVAFLYGQAPQATNGMFTVFSNKLWGGLDNPQLQEYYAPDYGSETEYQVFSKMWSDLRTSKLTYVDEFLDNFLDTNLRDCGEFLYNYDYHVKYLSTAQIDFLNGNRVSFIRNWLKDRIIFLDSVFGYKTPVEESYLVEPAVAEAPYIDPYNLPWKNQVKLYHNSKALTLPVTTNKSVIMRTVIGNVSTTYTYVPKNTTTYIPVADAIGTASVNTLINNSDCITDIDMTGIGLYNIEPQTGVIVKNLDNMARYSALSELKDIYQQWGSFASLRKLNLRNAALNGTLDYFKLFKTWDSSSYGVDPEAFKLQELNLSGVQNANVTANLVGISNPNSLIPTIYKAPFTNVTSIDVSNSNISTVTIPTGVSLYNLNVTNSNIQTLQLIDQPLLGTPDFNGCVNLSDISIINCNRFINLTFNTSTKALRKIIISGCKNLETLTINGGNAYMYLPAISVESCPKLRSVIITGCNSTMENPDNPESLITLSDVPNLQNLNISGCYYKKIEWDGIYVNENGERKGMTNLSTLDLSGSRVSQIISRMDDNDPGAVNLRGFKSDTLRTVNFNANEHITHLYFDNIEGEPFRLQTTAAFANCTNLQRLYGNFELAADRVFIGSIKFNIHGNTQRFDINGRNLPTFELNVWKHPMDMGITTANGVKFQSGELVTNMRLVSNAIYAFQDTACNTFDVYYILMNIDSTVTNITGLFQGSAVKFDWGSGYDNSPNRYMFSRCGNIRTMDSLFYGCQLSGRILSPYTDNSGTVIPGLLTPLKNLTSWNLIFYPLSGFVCDNKAFRTLDNTKFNINYLAYFAPGMVVNDANNIDYNTYVTYAGSPVSYKVKLGDLSGFFTDMPKLAGNLYGAFNNVAYIDYTKFRKENLNIPEGVNTLTGAFVSNYAQGELELTNMFRPEACASLENIYNSFRVDNYNKDAYVTVTIRESLLQPFQNLINVGYVTSGQYVGSNQTSAFSGNGLKKVMDPGSFPYNMLQSNPKLQSFVAFFNGCDMTEVEDNNTLQLPGSLFNYTPELKDVSYCFYNIKTVNPIQLTDMPFERCPRIQNVSYMFGHDADRDATASSVRGAALPLKFFYHGHTVSTKPIVGSDYDYVVDNVVIKTSSTSATAIESVDSKTETTTTGTITIITNTVYTNEYTGFDEIEGSETSILVTPATTITAVTTVTKTTQYADGTTSVGTPVRTTQYVDMPGLSDHIIEYNIEYDVMNTSLNNLEGCFAGADIFPYVHNWAVDELPESNSEYQPFKYVLDGGRWKKAEVNNIRYTYEWVYDGNRQNYLEHIINETVLNNIKKRYPTTVNGKEYTYEFTIPDDAWLDGYTDYEEMKEQIQTYCVKPTLGNWGEINGKQIENCCGDEPDNFCLPPDIFRYCNSGANINYMFYKCGMDSHVGTYPLRVDTFGVGNSNNEKAYGLKGRLCPYLLKPLPNITSMVGTFHTCCWLGGYRKKGSVYLIPESFFSYLKSPTLNMKTAFKCWAFPAKSTLDVFHFKHNITMNVEEAFMYMYVLNNDFDGNVLTSQGSTTISNVFSNPSIYIRGMRCCFANSTQTTGTRVDQYKPSQVNLAFSNVFNPIKYDKSVDNSDKYVFAGYNWLVDSSDNTVNARFGTKTLRTDKERKNYAAMEKTIPTT